jgi:hypothetical protein
MQAPLGQELPGQAPCPLSQGHRLGARPHGQGRGRPRKASAAHPRLPMPARPGASGHRSPPGGAVGASPWGWRTQPAPPARPARPAHRRAPRSRAASTAVSLRRRLLRSLQAQPRGTARGQGGAAGRGGAAASGNNAAGPTAPAPGLPDHPSPPPRSPSPARGGGGLATRFPAPRAGPPTAQGSRGGGRWRAPGCEDEPAVLVEPAREAPRWLRSPQKPSTKAPRLQPPGRPPRTAPSTARTPHTLRHARTLRASSRSACRWHSRCSRERQATPGEGPSQPWKAKPGGGPQRPKGRLLPGACQPVPLLL